MSFWDSPYPGQPVDPGMPPGYQPPVDPLTAALLAQRASAQNPQAADYTPISNAPVAGYLAQPGHSLGEVAGGIADSLGNAATLAGRALYGPESAGWERYGAATPDQAVNAASWVAMPGLGRAALAPASENVLGIFGGKLAKTADLDALKTAQDMAAAGAGRGDIWNKTGWFQGADGQWRFEIPDTASSAKREYQSPASLPDRLAHDPLYQAYPQMKDVEVVSSNGGTAKGTFTGDPTEGAIMSLRPGSTDSIRSTALHETQHGVQNIEGFAKGGNNYFLNPGTPAWDIYQSRIKAILDPGTLEEFALKAGYDSPQAAAADYAQHVKTLKGYARNGLPSWLDRSAQESAVQEAYQRSAGEVEARNVQARRDMTPEQLKANPPWTTQDVPTDQQIITMRMLTPQ